ncbi:hypothetical protein K488DRAFT_92625, partial [Vararia minispora EC-137]
ADADADDADADYLDPALGTTKKRKVPAHAPGTQPDASSPHPDRTSPQPPPAPRRILASTRVGLARKELLRARKHRLAAALGALAHGDSLALDTALAAHHPLLVRSARAEGGMRPARRRPRRPVRAWQQSSAVTAGAGMRFPSSEFTFACPCATADRLVAMREEVAVLQRRIEAELARQAARAEEAARAAEAARVAAKPRKTRSNANGAADVAAPTTAAAAAAAATVAATAPAPAGKRGKKKKRSALANASNPHHLRNYVPSRLPNQAPSASTTDLLSPLPVRFLSAGSAGALVSPAEEWICPTCEYRLFYGDEGAYRLAIRNRKKILKRRRRARERAAAAASGKARAGPGPGPGPDAGGEDEELTGEEDGEGEEEVVAYAGADTGPGGGGGGGGAERQGVGQGAGAGRGGGRLRTKGGK